jgi:hypothetical protein
MLKAQRKNIKTLQRNIESSLDDSDKPDTVQNWRREIAEATLRFIDSIK